MIALAASQAAAIWVSSCFGNAWVMPLIFLVALRIAWIVFRQRGRHDFNSAVALSLSLILGLTAGAMSVKLTDDLAKTSVAALSGSKARISGEIYWVYETSYGKQISVGELFCEEVGEVGGKAILELSHEEAAEFMSAEPGDRLSFVGNVELIEGRLNPGAFNPRFYWFLKGVHARITGTLFVGGSAGSAGIAREAAWVFFKAFKSFTGRHLTDKVSKQLIDAIVLSDKSELDSHVADAFRQGGIAHVMSASGLHVSIVLAFLSFVLGVLKAPALVVLGSALAVLPVYAIATGLRPSIIRACITGLSSAALSRCRIKGPSNLELLLIAASIQLLLSPMNLFDSGFQMSYLAVAGIIGARSIAGRREDTANLFSRIRGHATFALAATMMINAAMLPVTGSFYGSASVLAPIANIFAIPVSSATLALSLMAFVVEPIIPPFAGIIMASVDVLLSMLRWFAGCIAGFHALLVPTGIKPGILGFVYYGVLCIAWMALTGRILARRIFKASFVRVLPVAVAVFMVAAFLICSFGESLHIRVISVGQGDSILISKGKSFHMLLDTGPKTAASSAMQTRILPLLRHFGISRLDLVVLTHAHADHTSGLSELRSQVEIGEVIVLNDDLETAGLVSNVGMDALLVPRNFSIGSGRLSITQVNPVQFCSAGTDINQASMVLLVEYGETKALLCADAGKMFESRYKDGEAGFLKVGHHGSATSSSSGFLSTTRADFAVISVGHNLYGHPSEQTLERLNRAKVKWMRTDTCGMVTAEFIKGRIYVCCESESWDRMPFFRALK